MFKIADAIKADMSAFYETVSNYPHFSNIKMQMEHAQEAIGYRFEDINFLMRAFCRTKANPDYAGKNNTTYINDTMAQLGDVVLDLIIIEVLFAQGKGKREIDDTRQQYAKNTRLYDFTIEKSLQQFCYHQSYFYLDAPLHEKVASGNHDAIVEAIIGAIYLDGGLPTARKWVIQNLLCELL